MRKEERPGQFVYEIISIHRRIGVSDPNDEKRVGMRVYCSTPIKPRYPMILFQVGSDYNFRTTLIDHIEHVDDNTARVYTRNSVYELRIVPTEELPKSEPKYPDYIMRCVRQAYGTEDASDTTLDHEIERLPKTRVLDLYFQWMGIIGYGSSIKRAVEDIWGVKLDDGC